MAESEKQYTILELQARWDKIRVANIYDTLDKLGYPDQVLDLRIRPLFPHQHLAGIAATAAGGRDPRSGEEVEADAKNTASLISIKDMVVPGSVLVLECGGEAFAGKFGEMTSWNIKQYGAKGIVMDGMIRDSWGLEVIPDWTVCALGTSPIESYKRWRIQRTNEAIAMPGTLTSQVRVAPGDWIIAEADGVIVVPQEIAMDALVKAEEVEHSEQGMREDFAKGMSFDDAYKKWGRA
jgi:4-hydroxy-4-methyl-2-oxoglutarate aldolase